MKPWYAMSEDVNGIPITRYIASWYRAGGGKGVQSIRAWLSTLIINDRPLTDEEIETIAECAVTGKLELEASAKRFIG